MVFSVQFQFLYRFFLFRDDLFFDLKAFLGMFILDEIICYIFIGSNVFIAILTPNQTKSRFIFRKCLLANHRHGIIKKIISTAQLSFKKIE